jgi:hypothetical protein
MELAKTPDYFLEITSIEMMEFLTHYDIVMSRLYYKA